MISRIQKSLKKSSLILVFFLFLMSAGTVTLEAKKETKTCDEAFMACMDDGPSIWFALLGHATYCFAGWVFCKKYVEKE